MELQKLINIQLISFNFLMFVLFLTQFANYVYTLEAENLIGCRYANQHTHKYQVGILAKQNYSDDILLNCGGGIIADNLVLSAAHCFVEIHLILRNLSFIVTAGHVEIFSLRSIRRKVNSIYIPENYDAITSLNDIAVVQLEEGFGISPYISKLNLPTRDTLYTDNIGRLAGFGYNWVEVTLKKSGVREKIDGGSDFMLRYALVNIFEGEECKKLIPSVIVNKQFCGFSKRYFPHIYTGACTGDSGGPLVINNTIRGILVKSPVHCDDSLEGSIYNDITPYIDFINAILQESPTNNTRIYFNRPHLDILPFD